MPYPRSRRSFASSEAGILALSGLVVALLSVAPAAHAQNTAYTDAATYTAAAGGQTVVTFEGTATQGGDGQYVGGLTNVDASNGNATFYTDGAAYNDTYTFDASAYEVQNASGQQTSFLASLQDGKASDATLDAGAIVFAQTQKSFSTLYGQYLYSSDATSPWEVDFYSGSTLVDSVDITAGYNPTTPSFIGFTSTTGFDSVVFKGISTDTNAESNLFLDNVSYGETLGTSTVVTPEPGAVVTGLSMVCMTGLGLVRGRRRMRRSA